MHLRPLPNQSSSTSKKEAPPITYSCAQYKPNVGFVIVFWQAALLLISQRPQKPLVGLVGRFIHHCGPLVAVLRDPKPGARPAKLRKITQVIMTSGMRNEGCTPPPPWPAPFTFKSATT